MGTRGSAVQQFLQQQVLWTASEAESIAKAAQLFSLEAAYRDGLVGAAEFEEEMQQLQAQRLGTKPSEGTGDSATQQQQQFEEQQFEEAEAWQRPKPRRQRRNNR